MKTVPFDPSDPSTKGQLPSTPKPILSLARQKPVAVDLNATIAEPTYLAFKPLPTVNGQVVVTVPPPHIVDNDIGLKSSQLSKS
jgi:hypothetical protein